MRNETEFDVLEGLPADLNAALKEELRYRVLQQAFIAGEEQRRAMAELDDEPLHHLEAGTTRMMVHPFFIAYWNSRYPGCWEDPAFVEEFLRDNECVRVKCRSRKTMVSYAGMDVKGLMAGASDLGPKDGRLFGREDRQGLILDKNGSAAAVKPKAPAAGPETASPQGAL